jgi:hypothetical protein
MDGKRCEGNNVDHRNRKEKRTEYDCYQRCQYFEEARSHDIVRRVQYEIALGSTCSTDGGDEVHTGMWWESERLLLTVFSDPTLIAEFINQWMKQEYHC